jgi:hypothetical protein
VKQSNIDDAMDAEYDRIVLASYKCLGNLQLSILAQIIELVDVDRQFHNLLYSDFEGICEKPPLINKIYSLFNNFE